jgi:anti-sigma-K factor RskA
MTTAKLSDDDVALAGELVLGVLDPAEAAMAKARAVTDAAFAAEVARWEESMQPLLGGNDTAPPDAIWATVQAATSAAPVQDNSKGRVRFWQGASALSTAAALILAYQVAIAPPSPTAIDSSKLIAAMGSDTGRASMTASYDPITGKLTLMPVSMDTGRLYPELWIIPAGGEARSLGIVARDKPSQFTVAPDLGALIDDGATFAITPEPSGGAPNGTATGPVIASGTIQSL